MAEWQSILLALVVALGGLALVGTGILYLGDRLHRRLGSKGSRLGWAIHIVAFFGFLAGVLLAWMAYDSDHPMKERHLLLPAVFVALVYGYLLVNWLKAHSPELLYNLARSITERSPPRRP